MSRRFDARRATLVAVLLAALVAVVVVGDLVGASVFDWLRG